MGRDADPHFAGRKVRRVGDSTRDNGLIDKGDPASPTDKSVKVCRSRRGSA
jgi:hypothetical protein